MWLPAVTAADRRPGRSAPAPIVSPSENKKATSNRRCDDLNTVVYGCPEDAEYETEDSDSVKNSQLVPVLAKS